MFFRQYKVSAQKQMCISMEERLGYWLDDPELKVPAWAKNFSLLRNVQSSCEAQPATYSAVTSVLVQGQRCHGVKLAAQLNLV
jgi:hypothetical protein